MQRKTFLILLIFATSAIIRFRNLGEIPQGVSLQEVNLGLFLSKYVGEWVLQPFWIRFPFALSGTFEILLLYLFLKKVKGDYFAIVAAFLLAIAPWHIQQSRIFSLGIPFMGALLLLALMFYRYFLDHSKQVILAGVAIPFLLFVAFTLSIPEAARNKVFEQLNLSGQKLGITARLFSNKFIESYRYSERLIFENLDIGNYFFQGHPRERWGKEEMLKLYVALLPVFLLGLFKLEKKLVSFLVVFSTLPIVTAVFFSGSGFDFDLSLLLPIVIVVTSGITFLFNAKRTVFYFLSLLVFFEFAVFLRHYFGGFVESQFSPRRPVFAELFPALKSIGRHEKMVVSERLGEPKPYFDFYSAGKDSQVEFRNFNIWEEKDLDKLFVDVLPDDPSPKEPLYKKDGNFPEHIKVLTEFYDRGLRQTVVVYHYR